MNDQCFNNIVIVLNSFKLGSIQSAVLSSSKTTAKKDLPTNLGSSKDTMTRLNQPSLQPLTSQTAATIDHSSDGRCVCNTLQWNLSYQTPL